MMSDAPDPNRQRLQAVDTARLTPMIRKALDSQTAAITHWSYQPVKGGVGGAMFDTFLYRFSGEADNQGSKVSWSMMLKVLGARKGEQPDDPKYWKREAELYRSGLLDDLPGDFCAPRCFGVDDYPKESCWIWMEELRDEFGGSWPAEHYRTVARHLGQFNGAYLVKRPFPSQPWLSQGWFRKIASQVAPDIPNVLKALNSPYLKAMLPDDAADQYARLWAERYRFLDTLDSLPQTLCHLDVFRRNLIAQRSADNRFKTAAIDWAFAGRAALGADIGLPVVVGLMMSEVDSGAAMEIEGMIFEGYLDGLNDSGWRGDPQTVRLGCTTAVATKFFEVVNFTSFVTDEANFAMLEQVSGRSIQDNHKQAAAMFHYALRMADEARGLMDQKR